jgi:hypothetical protein
MTNGETNDGHTVAAIRRRRLTLPPPHWLLPVTIVVAVVQLIIALEFTNVFSFPVEFGAVASVVVVLFPVISLADIILCIVSLALGRAPQRGAAIVGLCLIVIQIGAIVWFFVALSQSNF